MDSSGNDNSNPPLFPSDQSFQDFEFDSFSDFNDVGGNQNSAASIDVEEYAFQELDLDEVRYRSIQTVNPNSFSSFNAPSLNSMAPPQLGKTSLSSHSNSDRSLTKPPATIVVVDRPTRPVVVPDQPFYVAPTQFTAMHNIDTVISMIESDLSSVLEISYEFHHEKCRWDCVYLSGASRCKFEFSVYKNGHGSYLIEGNRFCGDSLPFSAVFRSVRSKFIEEVCSSPKSVMNFQFIPLPETVVELSSAEIAGAVTPIIAMANSGLCESEVNAAQILCDLSLQQNMLEELCQPECVHALMKLCRVEFNYCNQHALCAVANLSSARSCQDLVLQDEAFLRQLLLLCCDGTYNTVEMRRESARLLANLCAARANAVKVFQVVGEASMTRWLDSVGDLKDERLRLHAERAKHALHACLV